MNDPAGKMKVAQLVTFLAWGGRIKLLIAPLLGERGRLAALSRRARPSAAEGQSGRGLPPLRCPDRRRSAARKK
jgi:hypothetical protein